MNCLDHLGMLLFQAMSWKVFAFNQGVSHVLTHLRHQGLLQQHGTLNTDMMPLIEASKNPIDVALNGFSQVCNDMLITDDLSCIGSI